MKKLSQFSQKIFAISLISMLTIGAGAINAQGNIKATKNNKAFLVKVVAQKSAFNKQQMLINNTSKKQTATGKYAEIEKIGTAIDAVNTICSLKSRLELPSPQVEENAAVKAILNLVDFYGRQIKEVQGKKEGFWRKLIFGTRMPFSGRAVITSLTEVHDYDELHIPWGLFIVMYRFHIENKLYKRGYTPNQAKGFISRCIREWNPEMREIIDELIEESPYATHSGKKGLPVIFNRNPSLLLSSIQHFLLTEIKNDVTDNSISMSVLVLSGMNADNELCWCKRK